MKYFLLASFIFCFFSAYAQQNPKYINVNGRAELIRTADQVNFTVLIRTVDESVEISKYQNDKKIDELVSTLRKMGFSAMDIELSPLRLGKNYEYEDGRRRVQKGYFVEADVSFLLKDLSKYYDLTNKLASSNSFENIYSTYNISDYEYQHKMAYENALTAAKDKAEYMAKNMGLTLGDILEIEEIGAFSSNYSPNPFNTASVENSQIVTGKVNIGRSVRVKFELK